MIEIIENAEHPVKPRQSAYRFEEMEVGSGFDVPDDMGEAYNGRSRREVSVRNAFAYFRRNYPGRAIKIGRSPAGDDLLRVVRIL